MIASRPTSGAAGALGTQQLANLERIERLTEEEKGIADDKKDAFNEAKAIGYDTKIMRQIIALRKMKPDDRREMEHLLDTYKAAMGLD